MKTVCFNCGVDRKVIGEAGAPTRCEVCGCTKFCEVRQTLHASVITAANPAELRVVPHVGTSPERAHALFQYIHEVIDAQ
jgi:hypothetical protein